MAKKKVLAASFTLLSTGQINKNIEHVVKIFGPGSKDLKLMGETAFQCLLHASKHGDVTLCERLYMGLGGVKKGTAAAAVRVEALKSWFAKMGPITARNGKWQIKDGVDWKDESMWDLKTASEKPFWEEMGAELRPMDFNNLMNLIKGLPKRVEKAADEGTYVGDVAAAKEWANQLVAFAEKSSEKLTPEQRGNKDLTNAVIAKAAGVKEGTEHRVH